MNNIKRFLLVDNYEDHSSKYKMIIKNYNADVKLIALEDSNEGLKFIDKKYTCNTIFDQKKLQPIKSGYEQINK